MAVAVTEGWAAFLLREADLAGTEEEEQILRVVLAWAHEAHLAKAVPCLGLQQVPLCFPEAKVGLLHEELPCQVRVSQSSSQ